MTNNIANHIHDRAKNENSNNRVMFEMWFFSIIFLLVCLSKKRQIPPCMPIQFPLSIPDVKYTNKRQKPGKAELIRSKRSVKRVERSWV